MLADVALGEEVEGDVEGAGVGEERGNVLEEDARLGEVGDVAEVGAETAAAQGEAGPPVPAAAGMEHRLLALL